MTLKNKIILTLLGAIIIPVIVVASVLYPYLSDTSDYFLLLLFVVIIFSIFIGLKISKSLTDPLRNLSFVAGKFSKDPGSKIRARVYSKDEIGMLAENFNEMADKINESYVQIDSANQQMKASNQQLKASNQQLNAANQQLIASRESLKEKLRELEVFNKATVGRELAMIELKKEVETLKSKLMELNK